MIRTRLLHPDTGVRLPARVTVGGAGAQTVPPGALHEIISDTIPSPPLVPKPAYFAAGHSANGVTPPQAGHQAVTWTLTNQFDVYLDNSAEHPQANFQLVTYSLSGEFTPKEPDEKFQYMDDPFRVLLGSLNMKRAWSTGSVDVSVRPDAATESKITWQASDPATPDANTYTSGEQFEIGFSASADGPGVSGSYTISNEHEHTVPDWGVTNTTAGNDLQWQFSSRSPCDVRPQNGNAGCFGSYGTPVRPNDLSLGQLPIDVTGR